MGLIFCKAFRGRANPTNWAPPGPGEMLCLPFTERQSVLTLCVVVLTRNWILLMLKVLELRMWSARRPGVATTTWGWLDNSKAWLTISVDTRRQSQHAEQNSRVTDIIEASISEWGWYILTHCLTHSTNNDAISQPQWLPQDSKLLCDLIGQFSAWRHMHNFIRY